MISLKLFLTQDMSEVSFLKPFFLSVDQYGAGFLLDAGMLHENDNLLAINISCWLCSTIIFTVIVQM